ncbi:MAG TPA: hypothetical protein VMV73_00605 [Candidatus Dormibacteraeota bacterium]|nr:hypothetical protein [Candidatus Dormibacteraeota bacterium]
MIAYRALLAVAFTLIGVVVIFRVLALGFNLHALPGIVLGGALIALGLYRLRQIAEIRRRA